MAEGILVVTHPELVRLVTEPDAEAVKLHEMLASLIEVIAVNTLRVLQRSLTGQSAEEPAELH